ncbi:MAG: alpha/beta fold hydrolase [Alphaproteobacteria bacterium]|nr:alpha/beta fold hydrolase [Alphaproteobacteria bacterium]
MPTPALVLLPGLLCTELLWRHQIEHLSHRSEILVGDLRQGQSMAEMAHHVLTKAPERFALAGLSMGGYVAFEILRQAPERVIRLALINTSARGDTAEQRQRRLTLIQLCAQGEFRGVTPRLLPLFIPENRLADSVLVQTIEAMAKVVGRDAFVRQQQAIMGRPDSRSSLAAIHCPTVIVGGAEDQLTPPDVHHEMAEHIAGAQLHVLPACGHLSPLECPEEVTLILDRWIG